VSKQGSGALYIGVFGLLLAEFSGSICQAADLALYGVGHLSYDAIDTGVSSSDYVHSNSSRLGIKGDQDLNDALSVYVQYESGVDLRVTARATGTAVRALRDRFSPVPEIHSLDSGAMTTAASNSAGSVV